MIKIAKNQFRWTVTLNRPNKANAINIEMLEQLNSIMDAAKKENSLRSLIFTGAGKVFSAGADLVAIKNNNEIITTSQWKDLSEKIVNYYNSNSTDFLLDLPEEFKNVTSLTVVNVQIPNSNYTFSSKLGTNEFTIETYDGNYTNKKTTTVRIKNGNYSAKELVDYLNKYIFSKDAKME